MAKVANKYNGEFTNSVCTAKSASKEGKFEWHAGVEKNLQTSVGGKGALEESNGLGVGCQSEHSTGEYSGTKEVKNLVVTFNNCESAGFECSSAGRKAGELVTHALEGKVVWEKKSALKTALDLFPANGAEKFIEFSCGATLTIAVRGSILTPVVSDKMSLTVPLKYLQKRGIQAPTEYETASGEKVKDFLEGDFSNKGWLQAGQTITSTVTNEEKLELNAVV